MGPRKKKNKEERLARRSLIPGRRGERLIIWDDLVQTPEQAEAFREKLKEFSVKLQARQDGKVSSEGSQDEDPGSGEQAHVHCVEDEGPAVGSEDRPTPQGC